MESRRKYVDYETTEVVNDYLVDTCSEHTFLCANKELCAKNTSHLGDLKNINKICKDFELSGKCSRDVDLCTVTVPNGITTSKKNVTTTFMNIIVPIPGSTDEYGNIKFLRLPPLSGSKIPGSDDICNSCACFERFAVAPGTQSGENSKYTSPGQSDCLFRSGFEFYYYPLDVENITAEIVNEPDVILGNYKVVSKNIIYANNNEDLFVDNLYDILIKNGISSAVAFSFITKTLWPNDNNVLLQLKLHIKNKKLTELKDKQKFNFSKNVISLYIIFIIFVILLLFNLM
uniref:Uncharacterized protein n=1 Tax=viral metagenome TaxID=1070528 RepID=A0A6C0IAR3_9ZZZZ